MPVRALTIDFWNTMVVSHTNGRRRQAQRLEHLLSVVRSHRPEATTESVQAAYREASRRWDATWKQENATPTSSAMLRGIWDSLGLTIDAAEHDQTVHLFEEGLLFGPPDFADGLETTLAWAAEHYRLGIISDTMFSPGRVIRKLLEQRGLLHYFDAFVFSDETGFSKPDVRAFEQAGVTLGISAPHIAHIGDLRRTDVAGAQEAGLKSILFTGVREDDDDTPTPDAVLAHWQALPEILAQLGH